VTDREVVLRMAWKIWGTGYIWGGATPHGFDCSGMIIEMLQSVGAFPRGQDTTANGLMVRYPETKESELIPTDLIFWVNAGGRATHVGMAMDPPHLYLGAEGGGSTTRTLADAWKRKAYAKIRPIHSRGTKGTRRFARWGNER